MKKTHEYSAPLVPPISSDATSDTAMRAPTISSPLIEPAWRRASTAGYTIRVYEPMLILCEIAYPLHPFSASGHNHRLQKLYPFR
jgi:hypothetical protein